MEMKEIYFCIYIAKCIYRYVDFNLNARISQSMLKSIFGKTYFVNITYVQKYVDTIYFEFIIQSI